MSAWSRLTIRVNPFAISLVPFGFHFMNCRVTSLDISLSIGASRAIRAVIRVGFPDLVFITFFSTGCRQRM